MTLSTLKNQVQKISRSLVMALTLLIVAACGGGGGSGGGGGNPTAAALKINLTGSLPASTAISGAGFIITLPANVTAATTGGTVASSVVSLSGTFAGSTVPPQVLYTAATSTTLGTIKVILASSAAAGVTQVGEVATVALLLANGAAPTAASFGVSEATVVDVGTANSINGMGVTVAAVTLQ